MVNKRSAMNATFPLHNHYAAGLLPFVYLCDSLLGGLFTVAAVAVVFMLALGSARLLRGVIPKQDPEQGQYLFFAVIGAAWVGVMALLLEAWLYPLRQHLHWYLLMIPMNATLLRCMDDCMRRRGAGFWPAACLFGLGGVLVGFLRESLMNGIGLFSHSAGALLLAGLLLAAANRLFMTAEGESMAADGAGGAR